MGFELLAMAIWATIVVLVLATMVGTLVRGLTLPRQLRGRVESVCGVCRYEVTPGHRDTCPECGNPYLRGGILTKSLAKQARPSVWSVLVSWTVLYTIFAGIVFGFVMSAGYAMGGGASQFTCNQTFEAIRDDAGAPTGVAGYTVRYDADLTVQNYMSLQSGTLSISVRPDHGPSVVATIDLATGAWQATGGAQPLNGQVFDDQAATQLLASAGIDVTASYVQHEAQLLAGSIVALRNDPMTTSSDNMGLIPSQLQPTTPFSPIPWQPFSLDVTSSGRTTLGQAEYQFESVVTDPTHHAPRFSGRIALAFADDDTHALAHVHLTLSPSVGWPVEMDYDPAAHTVHLEHGDQKRELQVGDHHAAVLAARNEAGLTDADTDVRDGIDELAGLIADAETSPGPHLTLYLTPPPASLPPAAPDGEPDGGFATQNSSIVNYGSYPGGPFGDYLPMTICLAIEFVLYLVGAVLIILRRRAMFRSIERPATTA
ncbi:MAG: hypothetical protein H6810_05260 [Phycisphaeraceae bacterium]|nr:MAG: hypothetical protein H6810_05260 [Phycisphaeraceae bacterium]